MTKRPCPRDADDKDCLDESFGVPLEQDPHGLEGVNVHESEFTELCKCVEMFPLFRRC